MDVTVQNRGSLFLFCLHTKAAEEWVREYVSDATFWAGALVVEPRFARDLADVMLGDGLEVA